MAVLILVCYKVDATRLRETLPPAPFHPSSEIRNPVTHAWQGWLFHRICWNFPCTAIARGLDGQNSEMEENKELVRQFVQQHVLATAEANCPKKDFILHPTEGEIHICHKTKPPYDQWKLDYVALDQRIETNNNERDLAEIAKTSGPAKNMSPLELYFAGRIVLDRFLLPPYTPRKALDRKSFPCHDACFYIFGSRCNNTCAENSSEPPVEARTFWPTLPDPLHGRTPTNSVLVTEELIMKIRSAFLANTPITIPPNKNKGRKHKSY
jgi:Domain of unknown function (DUF2431)